jgi:cytochrome c-type biogenesis protein CcmH
MRLLGAIMALMLAVGAAYAVEPSEVLKDPALEKRARVIGKQLRCLVCQNQSIDDSDADLARQLRAVVRERLKAGDSNEQIIAFVVSRYGDFVLLRPPVRPGTYLLWFGPAVLLLLGLAAAVLYLRRRRPTAAPAPLSPEEEARLRSLLDEGEAPSEGAGGRA